MTRRLEIYFTMIVEELRLLNFLKIKANFFEKNLLLIFHWKIFIEFLKKKVIRKYTSKKIHVKKFVYLVKTTTFWLKKISCLKFSMPVDVISFAVPNNLFVQNCVVLPWNFNIVMIPCITGRWQTLRLALQFQKFVQRYSYSVINRSLCWLLFNVDRHCKNNSRFTSPVTFQ